jgi:hypothetical protein
MITEGRIKIPTIYTALKKPAQVYLNMIKVKIQKKIYFNSKDRSDRKIQYTPKEMTAITLKRKGLLLVSNFSKWITVDSPT